MTRPMNKIETYVAQALTGSIAGQMAAHRDMSVTSLMQPGSPELRALTKELNEIGVQPDVLACHSLAALTAVLCEPNNIETITTSLTSLLWDLLGDPVNGGMPPEIYRKAGIIMHMTFLGIIDPSIIDPHSHE